MSSESQPERVKENMKNALYRIDYSTDNFIEFLEIVRIIDKYNSQETNPTKDDYGNHGLSSLQLDKTPDTHSPIKDLIDKDYNKDGYSYPFKDKSVGLHDGVHRPKYSTEMGSEMK